MSPRRKLALAWALLAFLAALAAAGAPGMPRDEASTLAVGARAAGLTMRLPAHLPSAWQGLAELSAEARRPLAADTLHGFAAEGGARIGLGPLRGARLGAALVAALLAAALALAAVDVSGSLAAGVVAPLLLAAAPRTAGQLLLATPDALAALLWLLSLGAFARSLAAPTKLRRTHAGLWAGLFAGLAAAMRLDLWVLAPLLAAHWGLGRLHLAWLAHRAPRPAGPLPTPSRPLAPVPRGEWSARLRRVPTGVGAALAAVPVLGALAWPWLANDPLHRVVPALLAAHGIGQPLGPLDPARLLALALPTPLVLLLAAGLAHALTRLAVGLRSGDGAAVRVEVLLLAGALLPLVLAALGLAPRLDGLRPAWHALPVLSLLGARALASLARTSWPARPAGTLVLLAHLILLPGARTMIRAFPEGAAAWGEAAGGAPGAAARGWPRQDGGEGVRALLADLSAHAAPSARVLWLDVPPEAVARYRRAGLVRADLAEAPSAAEADLVVVARGDGPRDAEYQARWALGSARAVATAAFDEVPLAQVFARAGAWR